MSEGRFWPTEADRQPYVTRFWVQNGPLIRDEFDVQTPGVSSVVITETFVETSERLNQQFPLYRIAALGKRILGVTEEKS